MKIPGSVQFFFIFLFVSLSSFSQNKDIEKLADLDQQIHNYYYSNFDSALKLSARAFTIAERLDSVRLQLDYLDIMYLSAIHHRRMKEAKHLLDRENEFFEKNKYRLKDSSGFYNSSCIFNNGLYLYTYGNYDKAIDEFLRIVDLDHKPITSDSSIIHAACNYLGQAYHNIGNLDRALLFFEKGWLYAPSSESTLKDEALYHMYKGEYLFDVGKTDDAFDNFKKALDILGKTDQRIARNSLKSNYLLIASYYLKIEKFDTSLKYCRSALSLNRSGDPEVPVSHRLMATIFYNQKAYDSSLYYYNLSLKNLDRIYEGRHIMKYAPLLGIANIYRDKGDFGHAYNLYNECLNNLQIFGKISDVHYENNYFPREIMEVLLEMARMYKSWYDNKRDIHYLDTCMVLSETAISLNDAARRELFNIETRESKSFFQSEIIDVAAESAFEAYTSDGDEKYLEKIYEFLEKVKGNILKDQANEVHARRFAGISDDWLNYESEIKGRLTYYKNRLNRTQSESAAKKIKIEYDSTLKAYLNFTTNMEEEYPEYYKLKYDPKNTSLIDVQKSLPTGSLLIHYSIGAKKILMAGITNRKMVIAETPVNKEFSLKLNSLLHQLANPKIMEFSRDQNVYNEFINSSSYVYDKIMNPILEQVHSRIHKLIIIPDGELCYLPFEVLLTDQSSGLSFGELHYLIKSYSISYEYSATLWMENTKKLSKKGNHYIGYAPFNDSRSQSLIASGSEVEECSKIWKGKCYKGIYASESSFKKQSMLAGIFHLAAHTTLNDSESEKSFFAFNNANDTVNDGLLYTYELYNMDIPARLAILSGCETGIGQIKKGEGIISLARAFKYAGCGNIIMSLWKINDKAAREIIVAFNKNLKKGMHKDDALQKAKLDFLKRSNNVHPAYWSSFVLIGNDAPVRHNNTLYYLIPSILIVSIILIKRKKIL